ncbi:MAG: PfkB family carbohydrate kinase, partial [Gammaproteobacteria bacterium]
LARLGVRSGFAGTLGADASGRRIVTYLEEAGVDTGGCRWVDGAASPVSQVWLNRRNGSRTIVHHRELEEFSARAFARLDLSAVRWLHFEGRNVQQVSAMMDDARRRTGEVTISLEAEKDRPGMDALIRRADVLLCGRHFALARGFDEAGPFLRAMRTLAPRTHCFLAWGECGAHAIAPGLDAAIHEAARAPGPVVDTLGAGDTFNAGIIAALLKGRDVAAALAYAVELAGFKCTRRGLDDLEGHPELAVPLRTEQAPIRQRNEPESPQ